MYWLTAAKVLLYTEKELPLAKGIVFESADENICGYINDVTGDSVELYKANFSVLDNKEEFEVTGPLKESKAEYGIVNDVIATNVTLEEFKNAVAYASTLNFPEGMSGVKLLKKSLNARPRRK